METEFSGLNVHVRSRHAGSGRVPTSRTAEDVFTEVHGGGADDLDEEWPAASGKDSQFRYSLGFHKQDIDHALGGSTLLCLMFGHLHTEGVLNAAEHLAPKNLEEQSFPLPEVERRPRRNSRAEHSMSRIWVAGFCG